MRVDGHAGDQEALRRYPTCVESLNMTKGDVWDLQYKFIMLAELVHAVLQSTASSKFSSYIILPYLVFLSGI